eukprot:1801448-Pyramimonas_sp.AAC.1
MTPSCSAACSTPPGCQARYGCPSTAGSPWQHGAGSSRRSSRALRVASFVQVGPRSPRSAPCRLPGSA